MGGDIISRIVAAGRARRLRKVKLPGRNKPCPCGSGKKFKRCCWIKRDRRLGAELRAEVQRIISSEEQKEKSTEETQMGADVQLGRAYRDTLTGFSGVAIGRAQYLYGATDIMLQPCIVRDGKPVDAVWLPELRLVLDEDGSVPLGGEGAAARQPSNPTA